MLAEHHTVISATLAAVVTLATVGVGHGLQRVLDPHRHGAEAWLSRAVLGIGVLVVEALILGTAGMLRAVPLVTLVITSALAAQGAARRSGPAPPGDEVVAHSGRRPREPTWVVRAAAGAIAGAGLVWLGGAYKVVTRGVVDVDSHHYHLSHALRFAQTGRTWNVHHVWSGDLAAYHPSNDELVRAVGMLLDRSDITGIVWNGVHVALGLLGAAVLGRRYGRPATGVLFAVATLTMPGANLPFAGGAANDTLAVAMLVAALALAAGARGRGSWFVVGLALGLAMGTKLTVLPAAAALLITLLVGRRTERLPVCPGCPGSLLVGAVTTGSYWFIRNLVAVGNPIPGLDLQLPVWFNEPTAPTLELVSYPIASYLDDFDVVRDAFIPGLEFALGPVWPVTLLLCVAGVGLGITRGHRTGDRVVFAAAITAATTIIAYVLTPTGAGGSPGDPWLFGPNVRYLMPATILGSIALVGCLSARRTRPLALTATILSIAATSATMDGYYTFGVAVGSSLIMLLVAVATPVRRRPPVTPLVVGSLVLAMIVVSGPLRNPYVDRQYLSLREMGPLWRSAHDHVDPLRIGVVGLPRQYGYAGRDLQHTVEYLGHRTPDGGHLSWSTCPQLLTAIRRGGHDRIAVNRAPRGHPLPREYAWIEGDSAFELVASSADGGWVYEVVGVPNPESCD